LNLFDPAIHIALELIQKRRVREEGRINCFYGDTFILFAALFFLRKNQIWFSVCVCVCVCMCVCVHHYFL
jgi:hypothetical protein